CLHTVAEREITAKPQNRKRAPKRAIRAGMTPVTNPNDGPDWKFAPVGVAAFSTLNTSTFASSRRPPPIENSLVPRMFRMFCGESLRLPYGSRRMVVLPFWTIDGPPSGSAGRKMLVRCPSKPFLLCRNPEMLTSPGSRYVPLTLPAHVQVSSSGKNWSLGLTKTDEIHRWFLTVKYDTWPVHREEKRFVIVNS